MARSMLSFGMLTAFAASIAGRSRGLPAGAPAAPLGATVISRMTLVQEEARRASVTAFLRLICFHLLWPAMVPDSLWRRGNISVTAGCGNRAGPLGLDPSSAGR